MKKNDQKDLRQVSIDRGHEITDAHFGRILLTGIGLLVLMFVGLFYSEIVRSVFSDMTEDAGSPGSVLIAPEDFTLPPEPRVEEDPHSALQFLLHEEDRVLNSYKWVSKDSGLVQVPIDRAMQLILGKGVLKAR